MALANLFMDRGADISKTDNSGNNALHLSIERGLKAIALKILTKCPHLVSSSNITGNTPLHFAAAIGDVSLCEKLLLCERKVTATNINGETPLHAATLIPNNLDTLKILIERGMYTPRGHLSRDVYPGVRSGSCPLFNFIYISNSPVLGRGIFRCCRLFGLRIVFCRDTTIKTIYWASLLYKRILRPYLPL